MPERVVCRICPHACVLVEGGHGLCRARVARGGAVVDENYGRVTSLALDPVEKKPLARWHPGSLVLSVGSYGCNLATVKVTIEMLAGAPSCHLEVTTLVVPGMNDAVEEIDAAAAWLASLDPSIPYHLTRFFPSHRLRDRPPTPVSTLRELRRVARRHLDDVLLGNC
ncbi:MAG: hypothetical protein RSN88_08345 [Gordonibacter sp.]|uniref:hypothetical protein n=1 Tax=Gordonibacter sp. TaxID=1968902 RepID=UPI002FC91AED